MNSKLLESFVSVYEYQSITKAAHQLEVTQSSITKSIKKLEESLNLQLFHRHTREFQPTEAAESLYVYACQCLKANQAFLQRAESFSKGSSGSINIGCGPLAHDLLLKPLIKKIVESDLDIRINFRTGNFIELKNGLDKHELDLIFYDVGELEVVSDPSNYEVTSLAKQKIYIVANEDHSVHKQENLAAHMFNYKWVLPPIPQRYISILPGPFKSFLLSSNNPNFEASDMPQALDLAEECGLITIATGNLNRNDFKRRKLIPLKLPFNVASDIGSFRLRSRIITPALKSIISVIKSMNFD